MLLARPGSARSAAFDSVDLIAAMDWSTCSGTYRTAPELPRHPICCAAGRSVVQNGSVVQSPASRPSPSVPSQSQCPVPVPVSRPSPSVPSQSQRPVPVPASRPSPGVPSQSQCPVPIPVSRPSPGPLDQKRIPTLPRAVCSFFGRARRHVDEWIGSAALGNLATDHCAQAHLGRVLPTTCGAHLIPLSTILKFVRDRVYTAVETTWKIIRSWNNAIDMSMWASPDQSH
jgi:hypothetical protein